MAANNVTSSGVTDMTAGQMFDAYFSLPVRVAISENTWSN